MTYAEARRKLIDARKGYPRASLKLANNTWLERRDDKTIAVRYHETDIVILTPHWIELDSGGWHTKSTASRISEYAPGYLYSANPGWHWHDMDGGAHPYFDGMRIHPSGKRLMATQPHLPKHYGPVKTVSGWSGTTRARKGYESPWQGPQAVRGAYSASERAS